MNRSVRLAIAAAALAGCASVGLAAPAWAAGSSSTATLDGIKARAATAISVRLASLSKATPAVESNKWLTAPDKATLLNTLNADQSALTALGPKIQADTTVAQARTDYQSIFLDYRVYALALPQVRLAAATDDITGGVLPRLTDAQTRLQSLLSGPDSAKNTAPVQTAMSDLGAKIQAITSTTSGLSATILALTPAQYDANHTVLAGPREAILNARADIVAARADVVTVVGDLK
ncbi:MAG TPA: hypothetical protein VLX59_09815 [Acidimicrobiales bacterium]|nr:hypothetical protein [Acidimicrobiales bacterium]